GCLFNKVTYHMAYGGMSKKLFSTFENRKNVEISLRTNDFVNRTFLLSLNRPVTIFHKWTLGFRMNDDVLLCMVRRGHSMKGFCAKIKSPDTIRRIFKVISSTDARQ
ncbi:hypothetical protein PENTCL1PPCAC_12277, partial [Pristionchus entomophagus]